ncbi:MAG: nitroreductase family protein [Bacillota bacterium]
MDVIEAIQKRRSIRKYTMQEVSDDIVKTLLDCARAAANAGGRQPWAFVVVRSTETKTALAEAASKQAFIATAPVVIVVCADPDRSGERYEDRGRTLYAFQDTASAVTNMMLAAVSLGLGTCWIGAFKESEVKRILDLPGNLKPVAMLPVGYPDQERPPRLLRPESEVVFFK